MANKNKDQEKKVKKDEQPQDNKKDNSVMVAIIGASATIIAAIIGVLSIWSKPSNNDIATLTPSSISTTQRLIFKETFDDNHADWTVDEKWTDFNSSGYRTFKHVENGKYYRAVETNGSYAGTYGSISIPDVNETNFCVIFDARITENTNNTSVIINARANNFGTGNGTYYIIHLFADGNGLIELARDGKKQVSIFEDGILWNDGQVHTIRASLQGNNLKIFDEQTGRLVNNTILPDDALLLEPGQIKLGLEILNPNQKTTLELDNVYVYDKCSE